MRWRVLTGFFVLSAALCTSATVSRAAASTAHRHPGSSSQWQSAQLPAPSLDEDDPLDDDDAPSHPGLIPTPPVSSLALPLLEPAAPRPPVIARNPATPRRVKVPAPSTDDVPSA